MTDLETTIANIFPNSKALILVLNETADFIGYSLIENGTKVRTKAVVQGEIFLDFGDLYSKELELFNEFYEVIKGKAKSHQILEETFSSASESEKKRLYLKTRDNLLAKRNFDVEFNYSNGTLDSFIIEDEFNKIIGCGYLDLEECDCLVFQKRKFNFKKDSLAEYLFAAQNELL